MFLEELGVDPALVSNPDARVPHATLVRAWELAPIRCGDEAFGLHAAERIAALPFDIIDYVTRQCSNIGERVDRLMRYQRLLHDANEVRLEEQGENAHLSMRLRCEPPAPRHLIEFIIGTWVLSTRAVQARATLLSEVQFEHAAPADLSEHHRLLQARLCFGSRSNGVIFPREALAVPIENPDPTLGLLLERHAATMLERRPAPDDFHPELRRALFAALPQGEPEISSIARKLHLSTRSLQRRLQQDGTTFVTVIDELRRELALRYLEDPALTLSEIGFLLGFIELSSFHRAFRRWTGTSPGQYRRGLCA